MSGIRFVDSLAELAETEDHHPDLEVGYGRVVVRFTTHFKGGVTEKDFNLAQGTDAL
jgi:4a-hydroxytetrahydrobiopterin dehydratase